jgi:hypothetical protein
MASPADCDNDNQPKSDKDEENNKDKDMDAEKVGDKEEDERGDMNECRTTTGGASSTAPAGGVGAASATTPTHPRIPSTGADPSVGLGLLLCLCGLLLVRFSRAGTRRRGEADGVRHPRPSHRAVSPFPGPRILATVRTPCRRRRRPSVAVALVATALLVGAASAVTTAVASSLEASGGQAVVPSAGVTRVSLDDQGNPSAIRLAETTVSSPASADPVPVSASADQPSTGDSLIGASRNQVWSGSSSDPTANGPASAATNPVPPSMSTILGTTSLVSGMPSPILGGTSPVLGGTNPVLGGLSPLSGLSPLFFGGLSPLSGGLSPPSGLSPLFGGLGPFPIATGGLLGPGLAGCGFGLGTCSLSGLLDPGCGLLGCCLADHGCGSGGCDCGLAACSFSHSGCSRRFSHPHRCHFSVRLHSGFDSFDAD